MKLKITKALFLLTFCIGFSNCFQSVRGNATTFLGGEPLGVYTFPAPTKLTTLPADGNLGDRMAMSCVYKSELFQVGSVAFGDASIASAAQRSGISRIRYVNTKTKTSIGQSTQHYMTWYPIIGFYIGLLPIHRNTEHCTSIYGDSSEVAQAKSDETEPRKVPEKVKR